MRTRSAARTALPPGRRAPGSLALALLLTTSAACTTANHLQTVPPSSPAPSTPAPGTSAPTSPPVSSVPASPSLPTGPTGPTRTPTAPDERVRAFPGAEGFGTETPGGRGGTVCQVTSLADAGEGTLRSCLEAEGPRIVVFRTGGTIELTDSLLITNPYVTVAGQTAPGDGITVRMDPDSGTDHGTLEIETHDVVIRYLRFRPGDGGSGDDSHDAVTAYGESVHHVVLDHMSFSWAIDENVNTYDLSHDITVSHSIIAEALSNAGHPDGEHSKGMLSGGDDAADVSIHHNLFASNTDRNPQVSGLSVGDVRNNVVYDYGNGSGDGVTLISSSKGPPQVNWVRNYYKPGPESPLDRAEFSTYVGDTGPTHQWYGEGNMRWTAVGDVPARVAAGSVGQQPAPFPAAPVTTTSAAQAYQDVLAGAGASLVRDEVDRRIVDEVLSGGGSIKDVAGPWPDLDPGTPPPDSDRDGVPDEVETRLGMDPATPDATEDRNCNGYDDVEDWFNGLVGAVPEGDC